MNTRILITAAFIFILGFANASTSAYLTFTTANGVEINQPIEIEETEEILPGIIEEEILKAKANLVFYHFDIRDYFRPEEEEPLPFDLDTMFKTAKRAI